MTRGMGYRKVGDKFRSNRSSELMRDFDPSDGLPNGRLHPCTLWARVWQEGRVVGAMLPSEAVENTGQHSFQKSVFVVSHLFLPVMMRYDIIVEKDVLLHRLWMILRA